MSEVSCRATTALLAALEQCGIEKAAALEGTGLELSVLEDTAREISWDGFVRFLDRIEALGGDALIDEMCQVIHQLSWNRPLSALARFAWSEGQFWRLIVRRVAPALYRPVTFNWEDLGSGSFRLIARIASTHRESPAFMRLLAGIVRGGPGSFGRRAPPEIRLELGPRRALIDVTPVATSGWVAAVVRRLAGSVIGGPAVIELEQRHAAAQRTARELAARNRFLGSLQAVADSITHSLDFAGTAQRVVDAVADHTDFSAIVLYTLSADGSVLELAARHEPSAHGGTPLPDVLPLAAALGASPRELNGVSWVSGEDEHFELHPAIRQRLRELRMQAAVMIPLQFHDQMVGVLGLSAPLRRSFDSGDEESLNALGKTAAAALMSARHVTRMEQAVAERVSVESALRASEERLRDVAENVEGVFYLIDLETDGLLYLSPNFERMTGHPRDSLEKDARSYFQWIHPEDRERLIEMVGEPGEPRAYEIEYRLQRPDGSLINVLDRVSIVYADQGLPVRVAGFAQDVTRTRELEHQLQHSQKMELVGRLAGGIAHDFNNLLTVISGYGELLRDRFAPGELERSSADEILRAAQRASALTRRLLTLARKQPTKLEILDLGVVVEELAPMLRSLVGEAVRVDADLDAGPLPVAGDRGQLEQVLVNLAVNARDAMPEGGTLHIDTEALAPEWIALRVSDTGIGMAPEVQARVFEPFFSTKEPGRGTGLGLATVQGIVEQAGGRIQLASEPERGACFSIELPRAKGRVTPRADVSAAAAGGHETLLLVEDQDDVRDVASRALRERGYHVIECGDAGEAMAVARDARIDLLVTDVVMPGMNGTGLAARLAKDRPALPVLFLSGFTGEAAEERIRASGAFLAKPYTPEALATAVRETLDA